MAKTSGWIRLHRKIWKSEIWNYDDEPFDRRSAWIDLLMMANFEERTVVINSRTVTIKRGQVFTSVRKLSERWHWSKDKVTRHLKVLNELKMATVDATPNGTLITLDNYGIYQDGCDTDKDTGKDNNNKYKRNIKKNNKVSTFSNISQRESSEEDIYSFLERRSK